MAMVVFMRGVNVGKHKRFQPSALARELAGFDVVNIGAAGTFVVRKPISQAALRTEILRRLPFEAEVMICAARELIGLVDRVADEGEGAPADAQRFVSILAKRPRTLPGLPLLQPTGDTWQVKVTAVSGRLVLSLWRRLGRNPVYPNEVVERGFGVPATTRNWNTIVALRAVLARGAS